MWKYLVTIESHLCSKNSHGAAYCTYTGSGFGDRYLSISLPYHCDT